MFARLLVIEVQPFTDATLHVYSPVSQPLLRRWIMLPLARREEIARRHDAVELLVRQEAASEVSEIRMRLKELGGLPQICFILNMGVGTIQTWDKLHKVGCSAYHHIGKQSLTSSFVHLWRSW